MWSSTDRTDPNQNKQCCGCSACSNICSKNAITMKYDNEGFIYPIVDETKCIDCGICTKVCPVTNKCTSVNLYKKTYAGYTSDEQLLRKCTSGGFATELSRLIIGIGGVVFGVQYASDYVKAVYSVARTVNDLSAFTSSKYVQSEKGEIYRLVKEELKNGVPVLFVGCPCDVAALHHYLRDIPENLYTCELVCMGVTSYKIAEDYKKWSEKHNRSELTFINARSKAKGWFVPHLEEHFANGKKKYSTLFGTYYGYGFQVFNRPSCFTCQYRGQNGYADVRVGDFWGIKQDDPYWNEKGVSGIYVRSEKGLLLLEKLKDNGFNLFETDYETATLSNMSSYKNKPHKYVLLRDKFAKKYIDENGSLSSACWHTASFAFWVKHYVPDTFHSALKRMFHFFVDKR